MNKDNAKLFLPLVQALAEGKTIQFQTASGWVTATNVGFSGSIEQYRIKPEPERMWKIYKNGSPWDHAYTATTRDALMARYKEHHPQHTFTFKEFVEVPSES